LGSVQAGAEDVELPTFPAPVFVLRVAYGAGEAMKRLVLTSSSGLGLQLTDLAELVIPFTFRFGWGPLPSPEKLATYFAMRSDLHGPGSHWSDYVGWRRHGGKSRKDLGLIEFL
jgi:hypothetical protein